MASLPPPIAPQLLSSDSAHSFEADVEEKGDLHKTASSSDPPDGDTLSVTSTLAERRFLRRLDVCLLTWAWCSYIIKLMDTSNYKTAFASGMKEEVSRLRSAPRAALSGLIRLALFFGVSDEPLRKRAQLYGHVRPLGRQWNLSNNAKLMIVAFFHSPSPQHLPSRLRAVPDPVAAAPAQDQAVPLPALARVRMGHPHSCVHVSSSTVHPVRADAPVATHPTVLMAFVPSVKGMYVLRFFIGVLEASSYPGISEHPFTAGASPHPR